MKTLIDSILLQVIFVSAEACEVGGDSRASATCTKQYRPREVGSSRALGNIGHVGQAVTTACSILHYTSRTYHLYTPLQEDVN